MVFLLSVKLGQVSRTFRNMVDCLRVGNVSYPEETILKINACLYSYPALINNITYVLLRGVIMQNRVEPKINRI